MLLTHSHGHATLLYARPASEQLRGISLVNHHPIAFPTSRLIDHNAFYTLNLLSISLNLYNRNYENLRDGWAGGHSIVVLAVALVSSPQVWAPLVLAVLERPEADRVAGSKSMAFRAEGPH